MNTHYTPHWLLVSAGHGPLECQWAAGRILGHMTQEAQTQNLTWSIIHQVPGQACPLGTLAMVRSSLVELQGPDSTSFIRSWLGPILWIGRSRYRPEHRRKNWFVQVSAIVRPEQTVQQLADQDLHIRTCRSSGPGGQHVNTTCSAVQITHLPTGLSVKAQEERSQLANKKRALSRLQALLSVYEHRQAERANHRLWLQHHRLVRGNPIRTFRDPRPGSPG